jgi:hypothetical protein
VSRIGDNSSLAPLTVFSLLGLCTTSESANSPTYRVNYRPSFIHNLVHNPLDKPSANTIQGIAPSTPIPPTYRAILRPKLVIPRSHRPYYDYYFSIIPKIKLSLRNNLILSNCITNELLREARTEKLRLIGLRESLTEGVITILSETLPAVKSAKECKI